MFITVTSVIITTAVVLLLLLLRCGEALNVSTVKPVCVLYNSKCKDSTKRKR
jgi:hypothetical protein